MRNLLIVSLLAIVSTSAIAQQPVSHEEMDRKFFNLTGTNTAKVRKSVGGCVMPGRPNIPEKWFRYGITGYYVMESVRLHQSYAMLKKTGQCNCVLKYPEWDNARSEYMTKFADLDSTDVAIMDSVRDFVDEGRRYSAEIGNICRTQGVI